MKNKPDFKPMNSSASATVEEISEEEAQKIELDNLRKRQAESKLKEANKEEEKDNDENLSPEEQEKAHDKKREAEKLLK